MASKLSVVKQLTDQVTQELTTDEKVLLENISPALQVGKDGALLGGSGACLARLVGS